MSDEREDGTDPGGTDADDADADGTSREPTERRVDLPDGTAVEIRPYAAADYEKLASMYVEFPADQREMGLPPLGSRGRIESWLDRILDRGRNLVATDADESLVGHALVSPASDPIPELAVFVRPPLQNRGVGTALCDALLELSRSSGHEGVALRVAETNRRAAHVYEKLGFEVTEDPPEKPWRAMEIRFERPPTSECPEPVTD